MKGKGAILMSTITIEKKISDLSMSEFETMRESKVAYEYILDILQNSVIRLDTKSANELRNSMEILELMYEFAYQNIKEDKNKEEQLLTDICCKNCKNNLLISDNIDYSYQCENCDENYYGFETEEKEAWYKDTSRKHLDLSSSFSLELAYNKDANLLYMGTENSSGTKYSCENLDDLLKNIEAYCEDYLIDFEKGEELC